MPGRAPRNGEQRLTGKQSREAGKYLRERWTPQTVWSIQEKTELAAAVNALFTEKGQPPIYSVRKLDDWLSNARYRANCKQCAKEPESWSLERRAQARQKSRKKNRSDQQKQRRDATAAKLRGVPVATAQTAAVPVVVGWGAAPRVQDIVMKFEAPVGQATVHRPADAGFDWSDAPVGRPRVRSQEFKAIRDGFERQRIGRTDEWASHRGYSLAPTTQGASEGPLASESAHFFEGNLSGARTPKAPDELVPTFLSTRGLPLPPIVDGDAMTSSPDIKPGVPGSRPDPLQLDVGMLHQDLDEHIGELAMDLDLDIQGLPVVEGHEPIVPTIETNSPAVSIDNTSHSGATAAGWLTDYAIQSAGMHSSQSTGMLSSLVDDNVGHCDRMPPEAKMNISMAHLESGFDGVSLDTRPLTPLSPKSSVSDIAQAADKATAPKPAQTIAVGSTVAATAVDMDLLETGFLNNDLVMLLPTFDESETPACLPGFGNNATRAGEGEYHSHTLPVAHAVTC